MAGHWYCAADDIEYDIEHAFYEHVDKEKLIEFDDIGLEGFSAYMIPVRE